MAARRQLVSAPLVVGVRRHVRLREGIPYRYDDSFEYEVKSDYTARHASWRFLHISDAKRGMVLTDCLAWTT